MRLINHSNNARAGMIVLNLMISIIAFSFLVGVSTPSVSANTVGPESGSGSSESSGMGTAGAVTTTISGLQMINGKSFASAGKVTGLTPNQGLMERVEFMRTVDGGTLYHSDVTKYNLLQDGKTVQAITRDGPVTLNAQSSSELLDAKALDPKPGTSTPSQFLKLQTGGFADSLVSGLWWAGIAYGLGQLIGSLFGMSKQNTQALSTAMAAGAGVYKFATTSTWVSQNAAWMANPITGIVVAAIVFAIMYRDTDTQLVTFDCMTWQAPTGGNDCEICNDDTLPCSEYRCRSLGQNCEIVNAGTSQERCVNMNPRDVNPPVIYPNEEEISEGHSYRNVRTSPPGPGFEIVNLNSGDGCLQAFTPLKFGITTSEPAQCKIDFNHTTNFDEMASFVGGSNLYAYNHTEQFSLPGAKVLEGAGFVLENGKDITFYLRCKDKNGNENTAEYAVKMCIDPSPDTTAPIVKATSVMDEGCVAENQDSVNVEFYTNEPASCRWSFDDQSYENMQNQMTCSGQMHQINANQLFTCQTILTGIKREGTRYYVRCEDQPNAPENDRNRNRESFVFNLRGSTALKISKLLPNGTIFSAVNPAPVELYVQTLFGCNNGQSICHYSTTGNEGDFIMFFDTNNEDGVSTQKQSLGAGSHKYFVECVDAGGNLARDMIEFTLDIDTSAPVIARIYEEQGLLKIITVRESECAYSFANCDFTFEEGTQMPYANSTNHVAEWNKEKTYYIKCRDEFRNEDADCSAVVRPSENLFG